ncbi:Putative DNA recombination protein RmuC [Avibacterium paragallinarum JF4211]|nr:Putative DNA recombination protein RmuC [Avibacterium paragallinarum JF4211]
MLEISSEKSTALLFNQKCGVNFQHYFITRILGKRMIELTQSQWLYVAIFLLIVCLVLFFVSAKHQRDKQELAQDLNKNINDFNQLLEKYETLSQLKNQLEQDKVKAETNAEGLQVRLGERDEKITYLQQELDEEQARHNDATSQVSTMKERFGIATAQVHSLQTQLNRNREELSQKQQECANLSEKSTALLQQLTELKTSLSEKESILLSNKKILLKPNNNLAWNFKI